MSTIVTLQLNGTDHVGDWATRPAGEARTATGALGGRLGTRTRREDEIVCYLAELRGAVESIRRGPISPTMADSRTEDVELAYGTPAMYCGIRFAIDYA